VAGGRGKRAGGGGHSCGSGSEVGMGEWGSGVGRGEEGAGRLRGWEGKGAGREEASIKTKVNTYNNICLPRGLEGLLLVVLYHDTSQQGES